MAIYDKNRIVTTGVGPITDISLVRIRNLWNPLYGLEIIGNVLLIYFLAIRGTIRVTQCTVFHVHGAANIAPVFAARLLGVPVLWQMHETGAEFRSFVKIGLWALSGTKHRLAVVAQKCAQVYKLPNPLFLPGAVDPLYWDRKQLNTIPEIASGHRWSSKILQTDAVRVVVIGNLNPTKGVDIFLKALVGMERPIDVKIVGSELSTHEHYSQMLYEAANHLKTQSPNVNIEFLGWRDPAAVRELLGNCDAFVLPSRSEACPLVLLEALAMGCLCVASDVGDVRLMLGGDARHRIFQPGAVEELRDILQTLESPPPPPRLNSSFVDEWDLERVAAKISAIYDELRKPPPKSM
jgi:glycosyltransferase involved in cell wall biosynthesis